MQGCSSPWLQAVVWVAGNLQHGGIAGRWCPVPPPREEGPMDFYAILDQVVALLRQRQRVTYRALQVHFHLEEAMLAVLTDELVYTHPEVYDDAGRASS